MLLMSDRATITLLLISYHSILFISNFGITTSLGGCRDIANYTFGTKLYLLITLGSTRTRSDAENLCTNVTCILQKLMIKIIMNHWRT